MTQDSTIDSGMGKRFSRAASVSEATHEYARIQGHTRELLQILSMFKTEDDVNMPQTENFIRETFNRFLNDCGFYMAAVDFDEVLKELSGDNCLRNDGTIAWYHQLSPILLFLSLTIAPKEQGGIDLAALEATGGVETVLRTHLRHDSIEDSGISFEDFDNMQRDLIARNSKNLRKNQPGFFNKARLERELANAGILLSNLKLMTRKAAEQDETGQIKYHPDGRIVKTDLFTSISDYVHNMVKSDTASPTVFMLKMGDGIHNLCGLIGADKFTPARRIKYCNEREDMYGARDGISDKAVKKWPAFAGAIQKFDDLMGFVLYLNFNFLEYADMAYPDKFKEGQTIHESGIDRYLPGAIFANVPRAFNPAYILLDRMKKQAAHNPHARRFLEESVYPVLAEHREHFPDIFPTASNGLSNGVPSVSIPG